jgi:FHA domain-containing protein
MAEDQSPSTAIPESGLPETDSAPGRSKDTLQPEPVTNGSACPTCGYACPVGALTCPSCGSVVDARIDLLAPTATYDFTAELAGKSRRAEGPARIGPAPLTPAAIVLDIDGTQVELPTANVVIIGRYSDATFAEVAIDLSPFGAIEKGVSRRHARITRKGTIAYIADIGSANGTRLNGQRLIAHGERLLRNGDELQLGLLKLTVNYEPNRL